MSAFGFPAYVSEFVPDNEFWLVDDAIHREAHALSMLDAELQEIAVMRGMRRGAVFVDTYRGRWNGYDGTWDRFIIPEWALGCIHDSITLTTPDGETVRLNDTALELSV